MPVAGAPLCTAEGKVGAESATTCEYLRVRPSVRRAGSDASQPAAQRYFEEHARAEHCRASSFPGFGRSPEFWGSWEGRAPVLALCAVLLPGRAALCRRHVLFRVGVGGGTCVRPLLGAVPGRAAPPSHPAWPYMARAW